MLATKVERDFRKLAASFPRFGGELRDVSAANAALARLHETVKDDEKYRPGRFREELAALGRMLGR